MRTVNVQDRYDQFQEQAVSNIVSDFTKKPNGRFLLVIPTGGGKTFTAVKAVNRLFETGSLNPAKDKVLWTAHRKELIVQARNTFKSFEELYPERPRFAGNVDLCMISAAELRLAASSDIKLVVIDEAHHAAQKNISYGPLFARTHLGILGLTATPSRHDGDSLDFERESFSIGFPDLVKKGIILKPEIRKVIGGNFDISDIDEDTSLEQLNEEHRNQSIIAELLSHSDDYKKIIVYVGTLNHVKTLHQLMLNSELSSVYDSISFITGSANSRNLDREEFFETEKKLKRSILVNVMVLSEGYDDPSVNTVVMATPSHSKLYYMQAIGRAIRNDSNDPAKKAFCVEIEDTLPNIRYRIDNRWLFSDVSDALEPAVIDRDYGTADEFSAVLLDLYKTYKVPAEQQTVPAYSNDQRYSVLLFRRYLGPGNYPHFPVVMTNSNRYLVSNVFNFLSERMQKLNSTGIVSEAAFRMAGQSAFVLWPEDRERRWIYDAMTHAVPATGENQPRFIQDGYPWITFVTMHYSCPVIPEEILAFVAEMVNRNEILEMVKSRDFEAGSYLIRLPLPLKSYFGKIITTDEFVVIDSIIRQLRELRDTKGSQDHRLNVASLLAASVVPIELAHVDSLVLIARTDDQYSLQLL